MTTQTHFNRRIFLMGTGALGLTGLLAACGGSGGGSAAANASGLAAGADISQLIDINEQARENLQQGGTLTLPVASMGPNFNVATLTGYVTATLQIMSAVNVPTNSGIWKTDFTGNSVLNKDYCTDYTVEEENGVQVIKLKLNPQAKFNDGTPFDIKVIETTHKVMTGGEDYQIVDTGVYQYIDKIEEDGDPFSVKVTLNTTYYPAEAFFGTGLLHPAMADPAVFNEGLNDKLNNDWFSGPFKVEEYNSAEKRLSVVPNENWWGEKPLLERIIFRQMESAAARAAFRNGEIDVVAANTVSAYNDVDGTADTEARRGQTAYVGGFMFNPERLEDAALRRAIFAGVDRAAVSKVRFNGLNWEEVLPGSMMLLPLSEGYEDNYPSETGADAAMKILEEAGYTKSGDYYAKDGKKASFKITTFGDDPVSSATAQTLVQNMLACGIECNLDNQPDANFAKVVGNREYDVTFSGYGVLGADASGSAEYFYHSEVVGVGSPEIDEKVDRLHSISDMAERNKLANEIEKQFMAEFATMLPVINGPSISFCKTKLANYGAFLFGGPLFNPDIYVNAGWMK